MDRADSKAQRLLQIEQLLWAHPEGLSRAELARRLGVHRSTITRYINAGHLPPGVYEDEDDHGRLKISRDADLTRTAFSLHEVMAIHLATRLLASRTDRRNPHAASALRKLGNALRRLDSNISRHLLRSADAMDSVQRPQDRTYLHVLEVLTEAWATGRKARITHQLPDGRTYECLLGPYVIEPYAVGQTAHVIGWREFADEPGGALRTLKIERIRAAALTAEPYAIPEDFDPDELLREAWGIWCDDEPPTTVVLCFQPRVAMRVRESRWHASQQLEPLADGCLLFRVDVDEPLEMVPWIRGWGADVEVLAPADLRLALADEARRLAARYDGPPRDCAALASRPAATR